jgi:hypothetical protein
MGCTSIMALASLYSLRSHEDERSLRRGSPDSGFARTHNTQAASITLLHSALSLLLICREEGPCHGSPALQCEEVPASHF